MAIDYVALKAEINNDPAALGYKAGGVLKDDPTIAGILNLARASISIFRGRIYTDEILSCVDKAEYAALAASDKQLLQIVISCGSVDTNDSTLRTIIGGIFAAGSVTRTAMLAKFQRNGSRAEQLFGLNTNITIADVALARNA